MITIPAISTKGTIICLTSNN